MQKCYEPISLALTPRGTLILLILSFLGYEVSTDREDDPCEIYSLHYNKDSSGKELLHKILIKYGNKEYASLNIDGWKLKLKFCFNS